MIQPNTAGTGVRIAAGKTAFNFAGASSTTVTVSYGVTFTTLTAFIASVSTTGGAFDVVMTGQAAPGTSSSGTIRLADRTLTASTAQGNVHWIAIGT